MEDMKNLMLGFALIAISGCGTMPPWEAKTFTDEFSDDSYCRVAKYPSAYTAGAQAEIRRQLYGSSFSNHLIAEMRDDGPRIGITSSHNLPIVGDLQIRVDAYEMVTVSPMETPVDVGSSKIEMPDVAGLSEEQRKSMEDTIQGVSGYASPYRMATGEKAQTLLKQMQMGKEIKFRTVGVNVAASTVAVVAITDDFRNALKACGLVTD
jgi:hypothetical protein